ncbi:MAG: GNAT family N-acetyltransferase [Candidatus Pristimantibacillus sp.]
MRNLIVAEDIQLIRLDLDHAEEFFRLTDENRTALREWLPWLDGTTNVEHTRDFIRSTQIPFPENSGMNLVIMYKGSIAGTIGIHHIDLVNRKTTIGYWLGEAYQGQGIMTKCCKALIDYIFNELELNRVEIGAAEGNEKSRAIPERLGFVQEGIVRQEEWLYDHFVDIVIYGMLKEDWSV